MKPICNPILHVLHSLSLFSYFTAYNKISELPTSFSPSLDDVNLEDSSSSSWCCVCLEEIELQHNSVEEVAEELFALPALQRLNLSHNKIQSLPLQLWKVRSRKCTVPERFIFSKQGRTHDH